MKNHGGARKGAGRKTGSVGKNNRHKSTITLPVELWKWLNKQPLSQSKEIESAILLYKNQEKR